MKKIKVLILVLAFAFASMGGAYAMWFDTLTINETASTGCLDLQWTNAKAVDPSPNYAGYADVNGADGNVLGTDSNHDGLDTMDSDNRNENLNVGSLDGKIEVACSSGGGDQDKESKKDKLTITLKNGYPGYQEYIDVEIENLGTVPAKFEVSGLSGRCNGIPDWLLVEIRDQNNNPLNLEGVRIDPGQKIPVRIVNRVKENTDRCHISPQNATATFTISLKGIQWNEYKYNLRDQIQFPRKDNFPYPPTTPCNS